MLNALPARETNIIYISGIATGQFALLLFVNQQYTFVCIIVGILDIFFASVFSFFLIIFFKYKHILEILYHYNAGYIGKIIIIIIIIAKIEI